MPNFEPQEKDASRAVENSVLFGVFLVIVAAGAWLLMSMADLRKTQDCAAQGRRNCATIENVPTAR